MSYESESFKEHHLTRLPMFAELQALGWYRGQILWPSPDADDVESVQQ